VTDQDLGLSTQVHRLLLGLGHTVAVAESLTGGMLAAALVDVAGASLTFRGGLVVYAADLKESLAGVSGSLLASRGTVDRAVAEALATSVRQRCGADWGVGTTGVAGPDSAEGYPPGFVWIAVSGPDRTSAVSLQLPGDRSLVRAETVAHALVQLRDRLVSYERAGYELPVRPASAVPAGPDRTSEVTSPVTPDA
jgi:nicotinamide-nucleotide amidase